MALTMEPRTSLNTWVAASLTWLKSHRSLSSSEPSNKRKTKQSSTSETNLTVQQPWSPTRLWSALQPTWVQIRPPLGCPRRKGSFWSFKLYPNSHPIDRGAWWATVHRSQELDPTERLTHTHYFPACGCLVLQLCPTLLQPTGSSVCGIFKARILEQVAISSSQTRDQICIFCVSAL